MQVENPPLVMRYFFGPIFSIFSPKKMTTVSCPAICGAATPVRVGWLFGAFTVEKPLAL